MSIFDDKNFLKMPVDAASYGAIPMAGLINLDTPDLLQTSSLMPQDGGFIPNIGGVGSNNPLAQKLGLNMGTAQLGLAGLQTIAGLWGAFKQASLAKKDFRMRKEASDTNLNNQIRSYNTALEDRARSRAVMEGQTAEQSQAYIDKNKARRG